MNNNAEIAILVERVRNIQFDLDEARMNVQDVSARMNRRDNEDELRIAESELADIEASMASAKRKLAEARLLAASAA